MAKLYRYVWPFLPNIRSNIMIGKIPAEIHLHGTNNNDVITYIDPKGDIWSHLEMTLDITHKDGRILKVGDNVICNSLAPARWKTKGGEIRKVRKNHPEFWMLCLEIKVWQPTIRNISDLNPTEMWITVGDSKEKCLHMPKGIRPTLPTHFETLLREDPHPHFKNLKEEDLGNLDLIDYIIAQHINQCATFSHDRLFICGKLHVQNANCPEVQAKSPLFAFHKNFQKMQFIHYLEDYKELLGSQHLRGAPCFDRPEFRKPHGIKNWLDVIYQNLGLDPQGDWVLRLFTTSYVDYLGYSLVSQSKRELCKYNMLLELKGFIPKKGRKRNATKSATLTLELTPHGSQAQYSYGSPVLATMEEVKKIGMGHQNATVTLKFKNKGTQNTDESVVKFNGINNYIIETEDVEIHINKEVLLKNSAYFATMCNNKFEEDNGDGCTLHGDDKDALVLCFKILYGCGAPLTYELLGNLLLVANKYAFVDIVKYLDTLLTSLARKNRLPRIWINHIKDVADCCSLPELKAYFDKFPQQKYSVAVPEEGNIELLVGLGLFVKEAADKPLPTVNNSTEGSKIASTPASVEMLERRTPMKVAKRPIVNESEANAVIKKRRLFDNDNQ